ncbi:hypothetical protein EYC84_000990 [Monilinia fructicola]|uniref:Uncharacterized protein n=1 Tax=Monilinia fructicola TaxID=38448 RepID=A0A5M9JIL4_MONFR|nr:hypothetical protein EYC84_000990 [Monilinia fructicola]
MDGWSFFHIFFIFFTKLIWNMDGFEDMNDWGRAGMLMMVVMWGGSGGDGDGKIMEKKFVGLQANVHIELRNHGYLIEYV